MKRAISLLLVLTIAMGIFAGCSTKDKNEKESNEPTTTQDGVNLNKEYNKEKMITLDGTQISLKDNKYCFGDKGLGFGITYSETLFKIKENEKLNVAVNTPYSLSFVYAPQSLREFVKDIDMKNLKVDEQKKIIKKINSMTFNYISVLRKPKNDNIAQNQFDFFSKTYSKVEELATLGNDTYYICYNTDYSKLNLTDEEKTELETIVKEISEFKNKICIFPYIDIKKEAFKGNLTEFNANTLSGEKVTQDIFKDYDITMVNIWATYCDPCIAEMPQLEKLYEELPKNVNMVTICADGESDPDLAKEIYDSAKGTFKVIFPDDKLNESVISNLSGVPTTLFVDKSGNVIGQPIVGVSDPDHAKDEYMKVINERLKMIGK